MANTKQTEMTQGTVAIDTVIDELLSRSDAQIKHIEPQQHLFLLGGHCQHFVIVRRGVVRVEFLTESGHELLLYRITEGQSCVITTACLLGHSDYTAQAVTETPTELVLIPQSVFQTQLDESSGFRDFVFRGFCDRLTRVMARTADIASRSIDQRLAAVLSAQSGTAARNGRIQSTHEQLALEVGTAREVISRRLASFEKSGILVRHRGAIEVVDAEALARLGDG